MSLDDFSTDGTAADEGETDAVSLDAPPADPTAGASASDSAIRRFVIEQTTDLVRQVNSRIDPCLEVLGISFEQIRPNGMSDEELRREIAQLVVPKLLTVADNDRSVKIAELLLGAIATLYASKSSGVPLEEQVIEVRMGPDHSPQATVLHRVSSVISAISAGFQKTIVPVPTRAAS